MINGMEHHERLLTVPELAEYLAVPHVNDLPVEIPPERTTRHPDRPTRQIPALRRRRVDRTTRRGVEADDRGPFGIEK